MRLIDADELKKELWSPIGTYITEYIVTEEQIDDIPIAHDTDNVIEQLEELEKEHPYRVVGQPDTYSQYNQGWCDCIDRVIGIVVKGGKG